MAEDRRHDAHVGGIFFGDGGTRGMSKFVGRDPPAESSLCRFANLMRERVRKNGPAHRRDPERLLGIRLGAEQSRPIDSKVSIDGTGEGRGKRSPSGAPTFHFVTG